MQLITMDRKYAALLIILFLSCNHIETGNTLGRSDVQYIEKLGLLEPGEKIHKFYSQYKNKNAGNFFTDKRMAKYWIDEKDKGKNEFSFAFYPDIASIDTFYYVVLTYCPYMLVTRLDGTQFKVCVEGSREDLKSFFEVA